MSEDGAQPPAPARRAPLSTPAAAAAAVAVLVGMVYFGAFNHDFSVNGLRYAGDVERGVELFHPNHLLPNALYWIAFRFVQALGFVDARAIWLMQAINVGAGIVAAAAIARIAARRAGTACALAIAALYAFGFAAWNFAEEPDVYVLPAAAVAASVALLDARERLSWNAVAALGALAVFAVLTLQQYVFWYPALLALVARRDLAPARGGKLLALAAGVPVVCLAAYVVAGIGAGSLHGLDDVKAWFLGYAWRGGGFGTYRAAPDLGPRLAGALLGLGNLIVGYEVILSRFALAAAAIAAAAVGWIGVRTVSVLRHAAQPARRDAGIVAAWCVGNLLFAVWWESRNIEFLFPVWLGALLLVAIAAPALDRRLLAAVAGLLFVINASVAFWPQRQWPQRYRVVEQLARHEALGAGDVLITEELNSVGYLQYFDHADVRFQPGAVSAAMHASVPIADVRAQIDAALKSGARVYTTEIDEHGRLREIARRFALLGRRGFDGAVDRDIELLYRGLATSDQPVPGVRRLRLSSP